MQNDKRVTK